ncbi:M48 family metallopeptidase [Candidatus Shapirobacteria bacterium]|nr:M48 family metallopeptidase [Candidatus Shapirobacteria bacterium]
MPQITLNGISFDYTLTRKKIRSLSLRILSRDKFSVSTPWLTPQFVVNDFIKTHADWIITNSQKFTSKIPLKSLKSLQILDKSYELVITNSRSDSVVIFEDEQKIYANTTSETEPHLQSLFDKKFRPLALKLIREELSELKSKHDFNYGTVTVKNTSSRYGSCSSTNNLNFNWQIIFLPRPIFRHILLHELTHTIHHNHSYKFWLQLSKYDPDFVAHRQYLKTQAQKHFLI